jgi:hypothetical protein
LIKKTFILFFSEKGRVHFFKKQKVMSLFTLPKSLATQTTDVTKMYYDKIHPRTPVETDPARSGSTQLNFTVPGNRFFHPGRSYVRIELEITTTTADNDKRLMDSGESLAMGTCAHFFTCCSFKIGGTPISRIVNGLPEIDALKTRSTKNKQWLDGVGQLTNFWAEDPVERAQQVFQTGQVGMSNDGLTRRFGALTFGAGQVLLTPDNVATPIGDQPFNATPEQAYLKGCLLKVGDVVESADPAIRRFQGGVPLSFGAELGPVFNALPDIINNPGPGPTCIYDVPISNIDFVAFSGDTKADSNTLNTPSELFGESLGLGPTHFIKPSSLRRSKIELTWQPPLGIFDIDHALPSGEYELELTWDPQWRREIVERFWDAGTYVGPGAYSLDAVPDTLNITVKRVEFHAMMLEGTTYSGDESYVLDLSEWTLTDRNITAGEGERRESFDVAPTTDAIAVAFQRRNYGRVANTVCKSRFTFAPERTGAGARIVNCRQRHILRPDLGLKRLIINYAGQFKPYCDNLQEYKNNELVLVNNPLTGSATNFLTERYLLNTLQNGTYFDSGGSESFEQWLKRGPYYMYLWPKDGSDHDTRAHITYDLPPGKKFNNTNILSNYQYKLLVFHRHRKGFGISVRNSRVTEIEEASNVAPAVMSS